MAFIKKLAFGSIFISILCIFAMSHNVNALEFVIPLDNYEITRSYAHPNITCNFSDNTSVSVLGNTGCNMSSSVDINSFTLQPGTWTAKQGDIFTFDVIAYNSTSFTMGETPSGSYASNLLQNIRSSNSNATILSVEPLVFNSDQELINYFYDIRIHTVGNSEYFTGIPDITYNYHYYTVYRVYGRINSDTTLWTYESAGYSGTPSFWINGYNASNYNVKFMRFMAYRPTETRENKEVEQKTQEAVDESQSEGSSSSSSASQGGANLLTAITGFFNVITSAQPTNCRFNAPLNTYFGNQNLNVDLCALDLPSGIGALTSIIAIGILIPFAIHMFNKFISLFRSFQS